MNRLVKVSEILVTSTRAGVLNTIPEVTFSFKHSPNDVGIEDWTLTAKLVGVERIDDDGQVVSNLEKEWRSIPHCSPEAAFKDILRQIGDYLQGSLFLKQMEAQTIESALGILKSDTNINDVWESDDSVMEALVDEAEKGDKSSDE